MVFLLGLGQGRGAGEGVPQLHPRGLLLTPPWPRVSLCFRGLVSECPLVGGAGVTHNDLGTGRGPPTQA